MTTEIIIDKVLTALSKSKASTFPGNIQALLEFDISDNDLELMLNELILSGYAYQVNSANTVFSGRIYHITYKGKLFLSKGGYKGEKNRMLAQKTWNIVKIIVTVIYSGFVLLVAAWGVWITQDDKNKDEEIQNLHTKIAAQQKEIESLKPDFKNKSIK